MLQQQTYIPKAQVNPAVYLGLNTTNPERLVEYLVVLAALVS